MLKRKLVILCLLTVMLLTEVTTVGEGHRASTGMGMTSKTTVKLVIPSNYTVQIPAVLDIPYGALSTPMTIGVGSINVGSGKAVEITVDSAEGVLTNADGSHVIPYVLWQDKVKFQQALYTAAGETQLHLDISQSSWADAVAGEYDGAITFHVSVIGWEVAE